MKQLKKLLRETLIPLGFKGSGSSWLNYNDGLLVRVSTYGSRFDETAFIDVCLTESELPIDQQSLGDWHAMIRITELLPGGREIAPLIKKQIPAEDIEILKSRLAAEFVPVLKRLMRIEGALSSLKTNENWLVKSKLVPALEAHLPSKAPFRQ